MKHILAVLFLFLFAQCSFAATATQSERLEFQTTGNDCYADGSPVMDGECYALVWKKTGATFPGFEMIPQAPNDLSKLNDDVWLLDYFPIAVKGELAELPWSSCPTYTLYLGWLPANKATNGTVTVYLLDTRYTKADGTTACGFDSDAGEDRPRRINAYTPISGLTDITVKLSMSPVVGKNVTGGSYETPTVANQTTEVVKRKIEFDVNADGGICKDPSRDFTYGDSYGELPTAKLAGHAFLGWFTAPEGGTKIVADSPVESDQKLFARWESKIDKDCYLVVLEPGEGSGEEVLLQCPVDRVQALPVECPFTAPEDKRFVGWVRKDVSRRYDPGMLFFKLADAGMTVRLTAIYEK